MKTMNFIKVISFLFIFGFISCQKDYIDINGEGPITTQKLNIPDFSGIDLAAACNVVISQGPTQEVTATGHANIINRIKDRVSGGTWSVELEQGRYRNYELTINVTIPNLNSIYLSGSGKIVVDNFSNQNKLSVDLSGSGEIDLNDFANVENMDVDISGSGTVTGYHQISSLKKLDLRISGAGVYNGFPIQSDECKINMSGSGTCQVFVRNTLEVSIGGSGKVYFKGNPTIMDHANRAGSIIDAN